MRMTHKAIVNFKQGPFRISETGCLYYDTNNILGALSSSYFNMHGEEIEVQDVREQDGKAHFKSKNQKDFITRELKNITKII